ncbi:MAG: type IV secretion system DNA-binding domain-containing protein [Saprospiraceae bacterium]|nr:type IV secretion system DNA-binding domain-containing protein [Saprospiraceae bacterium]
MGKKVIVTLSDQHRLRHMHVIGVTGTGKSSLLLKLIIQDVNQDRGIAVLDPHGDLIDEIIKNIPENRLKDVILVDPSDSEYPIGLNLLSAYTDPEKIILSSDLVALFRRFATSWGDQMTSVLANAINAIIESDNGGTLIDLRRFLVESNFRNKFLQTVTDPNILYYWKNEFQLLRANTVAPILTRLDTFLRPRIVRNMMAQKEGLDFNDILENKKILLVKLAQGLIGEENSYLLGTLFVAKLHQAAQQRQNIPPEQRKPFYFYIDEFQNFITPSMSAILTGARKYGLGLILAHQDLDQLAHRDNELANSVLSNPAIRVCFRCEIKTQTKLKVDFHF